MITRAASKNAGGKHKAPRLLARYCRASDKNGATSGGLRRVKEQSFLNPRPNAAISPKPPILQENVIEVGTICHTRLVSSVGSPYCSKYIREYPGSGRNYVIYGY
jgi:hypothetical protein